MSLVRHPSWRLFARLRPFQSLTLDLADVAQRAHLSLYSTERQVLEWADAGWLSYRCAGRDMLLEVPAPPTDAAERIAALLEQYEMIQIQRVDEIAAYARTSRCRHGHINSYLGGRTIERCDACDNGASLPRLGAGAGRRPCGFFGATILFGVGCALCSSRSHQSVLWSAGVSVEHSRREAARLSGQRWIPEGAAPRTRRRCA
jgi:hypothetical protein